MVPMPTNALLTMLGIEHPIICAPMGGGPSTPELVAAVSNAGGLGSIAAAYLTPEQITGTIARTRQLTSKPFAVNLFAGGFRPLSNHPVEPILSLLGLIHHWLGLSAPVVPKLHGDLFPEQFEAVINAQPPVFSFTFGIPDNGQLSRLRAHRIVTMGTATSLTEAVALKDAGVDAIIALGEEAGAHRGTFIEDGLQPTLDLVRQIVPVAPVIASGGIMDGRDIALAVSNGAQAVQMGTAFLVCPESGASETWKQALINSKSDTTVITRAFSGRRARGLRNEFIDLLEPHQDAILPYPWQNALTREMRTAAAQQAQAGFLSLWAGRGVTRCRPMPAAGLLHLLVLEMQSAMSVLSAAPKQGSGGVSAV
jgi:nitronate monooxygenase